MRIISINISSKKGTKKKPVNEAFLIQGKGILNDAHFGHPTRQVSVLSMESIEKMRSIGIEIYPGDLAENITVDTSLKHLRLGDTIKIGEARLKLTQIGKECHIYCEIRKLVGKCIMPKEGYFFEVLKGGKIKINDEIEFQSL